MKKTNVCLFVILAALSGSAMASTVTSSIGGSVSVIGNVKPVGTCEVMKVPSFSYGQLKGTEKSKSFTMDSALSVKCNISGLPITIKFDDKYVTAGSKSSSGDMAENRGLYTFNADIKNKSGDMKFITNDKISETVHDFGTGKSSIGGKNMSGIKYITFTSTGGEQSINITGDLTVNFESVNKADPDGGKMLLGDFRFKMPFTVYALPLSKI